MWIPYCGAAPLPADWLSRWNFDPWLLLALAGLCLWAVRRPDLRPAFWAGVACLLLLFVSPLCALSSALFSARAVHHVVLAALAAPLIAHGLGWRLRVGGAVPWAIAHALIFWAWHAPPAYAFALSSDAGYWLMQVLLLGSALGFWASLRAAPAPLAIGLLLLMMVQMGLLGALITFAGNPLYAPHWLTTDAFGLTALEDQQLAGLIMWAPGSALYLAAALIAGWRLLPAPQPAAT